VLIDGMSLITNKGGKCPFVGSKCGKGSTFTASVIRSSDGGNIWSHAIPIDVQQVPAVQIAGQAVRSSGELPEFSTNPVNGNLYAVWEDARFSPTGASKIAFSQSTNGGLTWSTVIRIDQSPGDTQAFVPQIHVASDGTIGLLYYDLENATGSQPGLTDAFIAHCHSTSTDCTNPASWAAGGETRLSTSGSFDYTTAPDAGGLFLGDYDGLTSSGSTFKALFGMSQPIATAGQSDLSSNSAGKHRRPPATPSPPQRARVKAMCFSSTEATDPIAAPVRRGSGSRSVGISPGCRATVQLGVQIAARKSASVVSRDGE
jgi:hypothetical protein